MLGVFRFVLELSSFLEIFGFPGFVVFGEVEPVPQQPVPDVDAARAATVAARAATTAAAVMLSLERRCVSYTSNVGMHIQS